MIPKPYGLLIAFGVTLLLGNYIHDWVLFVACIFVGAIGGYIETKKWWRY